MKQYTDRKTSSALVRASRLENPKTIADFCAGTGNLLAAAIERWPDASVYANDIDKSVFASIDGVAWSCLDFLSPDFFDEHPECWPKKFELVLLNPPFCFERQKFTRISEGNRDLICSVAFAFLLKALAQLEKGGELLAVMPTSTIRSDRDRNARSYLEHYYDCTIISAPSYDRFPGLDVSTYLVAIRPKMSAARMQEKLSVLPDHQRDWSVTRGRISIRRSDRVASSSIHGWIHTTSIRSSRVALRYELPMGNVVKDQVFLPKGALVIPRVGKVKFSNIAMTTRSEILSDCLLGLSFKNPELAASVLCAIRDDFEALRRLYEGTGAPYITKHKLSEFVTYLVESDVVNGVDERSEDGSL